jgi:hypothetical protein
MVPKDIQDEIYRHYRAGQEFDKNPSKEWCKASFKARRYVYTLEHGGVA